MPRHEITPEQEATEREKAAPRHPRPPPRLRPASSWPPGWPSAASAAPRSAGSARPSRTTTPRSCPRRRSRRRSASCRRAFNPSTSLPYFVVVERAGGLDRRGPGGGAGFVNGVPDLRFAGRAARRSGDYLSQPPAAAIPSQDGKALLVPVAFDADKAERGPAATPRCSVEGAAALRASAKETLGPSGLTVYVTGPGGSLRRLRHRLRRHRRHPARRRPRRRLPHPAHRLPQPDPALRRAAHRGVRPVRRGARGLPAGQERHDQPERAEPGHPVDPRRRRRHRLRAAARRALQGGAARPESRRGRR